MVVALFVVFVEDCLLEWDGLGVVDLDVTLSVGF